MTENRSGPGLYLEIAAGQGAAACLEAALAAAPAKAVLIRPAPGARLETATARALARLAQQGNAAALIENDVRLSIEIGADGVHLPWSVEVTQAFAAARRELGASAIVGAMAGSLRHDAMLLGEAGADYVGFGLDADAGVRCEMVAWWAELFEVPCVATGVGSVLDAADLARAGADFVGVPLASGEAPAVVAERIKAIAEAIATAGT